MSLPKPEPKPVDNRTHGQWASEVGEELGIPWTTCLNALHILDFDRKSAELWLKTFPGRKQPDAPA